MYTWSRQGAGRQFLVCSGLQESGRGQAAGHELEDFGSTDMSEDDEDVSCPAHNRAAHATAPLQCVGRSLKVLHSIALCCCGQLSFRQFCQWDWESSEEEGRPVRQRRGPQRTRAALTRAAAAHDAPRCAVSGAG